MALAGVDDSGSGEVPSGWFCGLSAARVVSAQIDSAAVVRRSQVSGRSEICIARPPYPGTGQMGLLRNPVETVASVTESGHDVAVLVEVIINCSGHDIDRNGDVFERSAQVLHALRSG